VVGLRTVRSVRSVLQLSSDSVRLSVMNQSRNILIDLTFFAELRRSSAYLAHGLSLLSRSHVLYQRLASVHLIAIILMSAKEELKARSDVIAEACRFWNQCVHALTDCMGETKYMDMKIPRKSSFQT